jgi:hypothetical protein
VAVKERSGSVHAAAQKFLHPYFEGTLFPGSAEVVLGSLPSVPGSIYLPGWVFMLPGTNFTLLGKLTRNHVSFTPLPGRNHAYAVTTILYGFNKLQFGCKPETVRIRLIPEVINKSINQSISVDPGMTSGCSGKLT